MLGTRTSCILSLSPSPQHTTSLRQPTQLRPRDHGNQASASDAAGRDGGRGVPLTAGHRVSSRPLPATVAVHAARVVNAAAFGLAAMRGGGGAGASADAAIAFI